MDETNDSTTSHESRAPSSERAVDRTVRTALDIGRLWAVYGLEVGRAALRTSAQTLRASSEIVGELSKKIDERRETASAEGPETAR